MIKKNLIFITSAIMITTLFAFAGETPFTKAFRGCTPFTDSGKVTTGGMDVTSSKKIVGWQGDRCVYREDINMMNINSTITCKFTKSQINELASVIEAYELVQQYSDSTPDLSNLEAAQNNPVSKVWSKYLQDSSVCTIVTDQPQQQ